MNLTTAITQRVAAIHLLQNGISPTQVSHELGCSRAWVYKWWRRFQAQEAWEDLADRPRTPQHCPRQLSATLRQAILQARRELEAEADQPGQLGYVGAGAIRGRLKAAELAVLPSRASIERVLAQAGLTHPHRTREADIHYPHLEPSQPHQVIQVDIVPHFLPGGGCVSCFNAIDPVSHYPSGMQSLSKSAAVAMQFLRQVWTEQGVPIYVQLDNESSFSGGTAHPLVLSKVVRWWLAVGVQVVFTPFYHPQSNGCVERFHQDYNHFTWDRFTFSDLALVQRTSQLFFELFRRSPHIEALGGNCPQAVQTSFPASQELPAVDGSPAKLPLTAGQVHFIRRVGPERTVSILYQDWAVPTAEPDQGVWATLEFSVPQTATLQIFDAAPDAAPRTCLASSPFPLQEPVLPLSAGNRNSRPSSPPGGLSPIPVVQTLGLGRDSQLPVFRKTMDRFVNVQCLRCLEGPLP